MSLTVFLLGTIIATTGITLTHGCQGDYCQLVQQAEDSFSSLFASRQFEKQVSYYTPNGSECEPGMPIYSGRNVLIYFFRGAAKANITRIPATTIKTFPLGGDNLIEFGNHSMYQLVNGVEQKTNYGWYSIVWNFTTTPNEPTLQGSLDHGQSEVIGFHCNQTETKNVRVQQRHTRPTHRMYENGWKAEIEGLYLNFSRAVTGDTASDNAFAMLSSHESGGPYLTNDLVGLNRASDESSFKEFVATGMTAYACPNPPSVTKRWVRVVGGMGTNGVAFSQGVTEIEVGGTKAVQLRDFVHWRKEQDQWKVVIWIRNSDVALY